MPLPLLHMTCCQICQLKPHFDEVLYHSCFVSKIVLLGRVISFEKDCTPRGHPILNCWLADGTGKCKVGVYYQENIEELCKTGGYVVVGATAKTAAVSNRVEVKLTS